MLLNKMVEIQNINIKDMLKNEDGTYKNKIVLMPNKQINSKNLANKSELHRILLHLDKKVNGNEPEKMKAVIQSFLLIVCILGLKPSPSR